MSKEKKQMAKTDIIQKYNNIQHKIITDNVVLRTRLGVSVADRGTAFLMTE